MKADAEKAAAGTKDEIKKD